MLLLTLALVAFVGSHFLLSHAARAPLVRRIGEGGFVGVYSVVALATLGWAVAEWKRAPVVPLWTAPDGAWAVAAMLMFAASVLFVGSVAVPNPALMGTPGTAVAAAPRGILRITRHPMMWGFALWAGVHASLSGELHTVLLCVAVAVLALVGARLQDGKKARQLGPGWTAYAAATGFVPFAAQVAGRQPWSSVDPGVAPLLGGAAAYALLTWAHPALMHAPQLGFWRSLA